MPALCKPDYDLGSLPFGNREYFCGGTVFRSPDTGEVLRDDRVYYADADALRAFILDLDRLESMLSGDALGIPSLPILRTDVSLMKPVSFVGDISQNSARLVLRPFTKTGRKAKYPAAVHFHAYGLVDCLGDLYPGHNGSHGIVSYCQDHTIGKAEANYWADHVHFGVRWKIVDGQLSVGSIDYSENCETDAVRLYQV